jgi:hypothetical protein
MSLVRCHITLARKPNMIKSQGLRRLRRALEKES